MNDIASRKSSNVSPLLRLFWNIANNWNTPDHNGFFLSQSSLHFSFTISIYLYIYISVCLFIYFSLILFSAVVWLKTTMHKRPHNLSFDSFRHHASSPDYLPKSTASCMFAICRFKSQQKNCIQFLANTEPSTKFDWETSTRTPRGLPLWCTKIFTMPRRPSTT